MSSDNFSLQHDGDTHDAQTVADHDAPPAYEEVAEAFVLDAAAVTDDGRIDVDLDSRISRALAGFIPDHREPDRTESVQSSTQPITKRYSWDLPLSIVIHVVGSRGDVQPFVALGNELQKFGHRVRLATHDVFAGFVRDSGLEFYPVGGDPAELMAYMVKNPGLIPSMSSLKEGDVQKKRKMLRDMLDGFWKSCLEPDPLSKQPFVAEAIIGNPPSFAHVHCAQALGIPVHLMFTMPWSSTRSFPHPLANLQNAGTDPKIANFLSYGIVEWMTWQGLRDIINRWRKCIGLDIVPNTEGPGLAESLKIPFTYCFSPALVPRPADWPPHIDVCGFFFREPPQYTPPSDLDAFLKQGSPPVYLGFGSIVIDDPDALTKTIIDAVATCGTRAIISRGWSKLGSSLTEIPPDVFFLGDCPHEWLFQHVRAVVHHGGAGTTACGILNARPTFIVPFFGDQPFWGQVVAASGAGPKPIPHKQLNKQNLVEAIRFCLSSEAAAAAATISDRMKHESGVQTAVASFHRSLPLERLRCDILPQYPSTWAYTKGRSPVKLSKVAVTVLMDHLKVTTKQLKLYETNPIIIENRRWEPLSSCVASHIEIASDIVLAAGGIFYGPYREYQKAHTASKANGTDEGDQPSSSKTAGNMALASAKNFGKFKIGLLKGLVVDLPFALAEGFRNAPTLYGEKRMDHGPVTDWKSGGIVAGKTFAQGFSEGLSDLVVQPYKGAKQEGALGFAKGMGKGTLNMANKAGAGTLGIVGYTGHGIVKSIHTVVHSKTRKRIEAVQRAVGEDMLTRAGRSSIDEQYVLEAFEALKKNGSAAGSYEPSVASKN